MALFRKFGWQVVLKPFSVLFVFGFFVGNDGEERHIIVAQA
jgi:hypothetical protein